ncbi:MAG: acyltransferase [Bacteroidales bacterium]|nr:acyltransferase [Bacteroidales bacterium]
MPDSRNTALDYVRVGALGGVVLDHFLQRYSVLGYNSGLWLGGVCVTLFFALSAWLFGAKWRKGGCRGFEVLPFVKKRISRVYLPLWIALLAIVPIEYLFAHQFDIKTIAYNVLGLGWARPFEVGGHLWFITMIVLLYAAFLVFSRLRLDRVPMWGWFAALGLIVAAFCQWSAQFSTYSHAGSPVFIWMAGLLFCKGDVLESWHAKHRAAFVIVATALVAGSWALYVQIPGWHDACKPWAVLTTALAGLMVFCLMAGGKCKQESALLKHLAGISYEFYLVHLPLLTVSAALVKSLWLMVPVWLAASWLCAVALNKLTNIKRSRS